MRTGRAGKRPRPLHACPRQPAPVAPTISPRRMVASLGRVQLKFVEAVYEEGDVEGPVSTYCDAMILEKSKWRRRRSKQRGAAAGEDPLHPVWDEEVEVDAVRDDSKVIIDVWNKACAAGSQHEFFGKVTLRLSELLAKPTSVWHELLPGRVRIELRWTPLMDGQPTGETILLTLPEHNGEAIGRVVSAGTAETHAQKTLDQRTRDKRAEAAEAASAAAAEEAAVGARTSRARDAAEPVKSAGGLASAAAAAPVLPALKMDYYEYTHRGGSGHGPKENQVGFRGGGGCEKKWGRL